AIIEDYSAHGRARGLDEEALEIATGICRDLYWFKIDYAGGLRSAFTPSIVEEFLIEFFPMKISARPEVIDRVPDTLIDLFEWQASTGRMGASAAARIRERISSLR